MYVPTYFRPTDAADALDFVERNSFATLISTTDAGDIQASHIPLELERRADGEALFGHLAKANRQWRSLTGERDVLAVFQGGHAYVSPTWYDHPNVPTWNYVSVHVHATPRLIDDPEELLELVSKQTERYETPGRSAYRVADLPPELLASELRGIVGFELTIRQVEAAYKLSQNRHEGDHSNIIRELEARGEAGSAEVAAEMKRTGPRPTKRGSRP